MASVEHTGMYNITACLEKCIPCRTGVAWRHNVKLITRNLIDLSNNSVNSEIC